MEIRVKICGLTRAEDAAAAAAAGATYGGVILAAGSPRTIAPERASEVFGGGDLLRCGVFVDAEIDELVSAAEAARLDLLQLHGDESPEAVHRAAVETGREIWKAIRPRNGREFVEAVERYAGSVGTFLIDGWSPHARGGAGNAFPWEEIAGVRDIIPVGTRVVVAGGLTPENVAEVVRLLQPYAVDVSSGVERGPGVKDHERMRRFIRQATRANGGPGPAE